MKKVLLILGTMMIFQADANTIVGEPLSQQDSIQQTADQISMLEDQICTAYFSITDIDRKLAENKLVEKETGYTDKVLIYNGAKIKIRQRLAITQYLKQYLALTGKKFDKHTCDNANNPFEPDLPEN